MAELGLDADWTSDAADRRFAWAEPRRSLACSIARRLMVQTGSVPYWGHRYGFDVAAALKSNMTDALIVAGCEEQCSEEERVESYTVTMRRDGATRYLDVTIDDGDGPFQFVLLATEAAVSLLTLQGETNG
jgi:hypothetical protein